MIIQALLSLVLAFVVRSRVVPTHIHNNLTIYHDDLLQFNLSQLFTLDYSKHPKCDVKGSPATLYNPRDPLTTKDISVYDFAEEPEIVEFISNTTFYGIFDNRQILIQNISLDAESFSGLVVHMFGSFGDDAVCSDLAFNKLLNRIYVLGYTNESSQLVNKYLYIAELDGTTGELLHSLKVLQDDNFPVQHRPQIKIVPVLDNQKVIPYVLVYDQGISSGVNAKNKWVYLFDRADTGDLIGLGYIDFSSTNFPLNFLYDIFPFRNQILLTGKVGGHTDPINLAYCGILISRFPTMNCSLTVVDAAFKTNIGYVGIMNTGQYVEVNNNPNNTEHQDMLAVCDFGGDFGTPSFVDADFCAALPSYTLSDNSSVSGVEGNVHQVVVKYVYFDNTYAGYSVHNFDLKLEWSHIDDSLAAHVVPIGKNLIRVNSTTMEIHRIVPPFVFIKAEDLFPGVTKIRVECIDDDETDYVPNFINLTKMDSMKDYVVSNNTGLPGFEVFEGDSHFFSVEAHSIIGNDLRCIIDFDNNGSNLTKGDIYDTETINVQYKLNKGSANFTEIRFVGEYAVAQDNKGLIIFMRCHFVDIADVECEERATYNTAGHDVELMRDVNEVFHWVFAWAIDETVNITQVFVFDGVSTVNTFLFGGVAHDAQMSEVGDHAFLVLAYYNPGLLRGYNFSIDDPSRWKNQLPLVNLGLTGREFFCPVDIDFDPQDDDIIEILSICEGQDQRILRYMYPPTIDRQTGHLTFKLLSSIPINFAYKNPRYCSLGHEFAVFSQLSNRAHLKSYSLWDDLNEWTFGWNNDDLNLGEARQFQCVGRAGMFTVFSVDRNQENVLTTYHGNMMYQANDKVFTTVRQGLNQYKFVHSYEFLKQVIHTLWNPDDNTFDYMLSFSQARIAITQFSRGLGNTTVQMNLKCTNGGQRYVDSTSVRVIAANSSTNVKIIRYLDRQTVGIVNLDRNIRLAGPVSNGYILGNPNILFTGRLHLQSDYEPFAEYQGLFNQLYTSGLSTVALHLNPQTNNSHFTFFYDVSIFAGYAEAQHGVRAYHFCEVHGAGHERDTVFLAYSTAEPANNHLEFTVYRGPALIAEGRTPLGLIANFTKIRVVQARFAQNNTFYVFAHNNIERFVHIYQVIYDTQLETLTASQFHGVENVYDFSVITTRDSSYATLIYVTVDDRHDIFYNQYRIVDEQVSGVAAISEKRQVRGSRQLAALRDGAYSILRIETRAHNDTHFYLIIDAESVHLYELVFENDFMERHIIQEYLYNKVAGFDGFWFDGNNRHLVHLVYNRKGEARYHFYRRQIVDSYPSADIVWTQPSDAVRPFGMTNGRTNTSAFIQATGNLTRPVHFFTVASAQIKILQGADVTQGQLIFEGAPNSSPSVVNMKDLFTSSAQVQSVSSHWPANLILSALLSIAGFFALKRLTL